MVNTPCPGVAWLDVEMHVAFRKQARHVRTWSYPDQRSLVFHPFLLGDTVSSASLHRLAESWGWVQSMFQIVGRKTMEWPVTTADPLKLWTSWPKKKTKKRVSTHPLESRVLFWQTSFSHYGPVWGGKTECIKEEPRIKRTHPSTSPEFPVKSVKGWTNPLSLDAAEAKNGAIFSSEFVCLMKAEYVSTIN